MQAAFIFNYDDIDFSFINFTDPKNETKVIEQLENYAKELVHSEENGIFDTNECSYQKKRQKKFYAKNTKSSSQRTLMLISDIY